MRQFFVDDILDSKEIISFSNEQRHHICDVLRMRTNDLVRIVDKEKKIYLCSLQFENGDIKAMKIEQIEKIAEKEVFLLAALIKKENWELIIQKSCELGATKIIPLITNRTIIHLDEKEISKKVERWNKIALSACQQSNRNIVCEVCAPIKLKKINEYKAEINLIAYENEKGETLADYIEDKSIAIVIGPEGGLEEKEVAFLKENGFVAVSLGNNILRAETACMYALSVISALR